MSQGLNYWQACGEYGANGIGAGVLGRQRKELRLDNWHNTSSLAVVPVLLSGVSGKNGID
jgi:hypothetical protein